MIPPYKKREEDEKNYLGNIAACETTETNGISVMPSSVSAVAIRYLGEANRGTFPFPGGCMYQSEYLTSTSTPGAHEVTISPLPNLTVVMVKR